MTMIRRRIRLTAAILAVLLSLQILPATAFIQPAPPSSSFISRRLPLNINKNGSRLTSAESQLNRRRSLQMTIPLADQAAEIAQQASIHLSLLAPVLTSSMERKEIEAEILGDMSHVLTDVAPFLGAPTLIFRLSMLVGRVFAMASDYVPDQLIVKDELFFQLPLLGLSAVLSWQSLVPFLKAVTTKTSPLDEIVFEQLFEPVGVNGIQFRSMVATCIDWVTLDPGAEVVCEHADPNTDETVYLFWLYEGDVTGTYEGNLWTHIERHDGKSIDDPSAVGLLSDMKFLYKLDLKLKMKKNSDAEVVKYPMATFRVGKQGATLMRIESDALYDLMEHDEHLDASIRQLLLKSLQRKVGLLLRSTTQPTPQTNLLTELDEPTGLPNELRM